MKFEKKIYLALVIAVVALLPLVGVSLFAMHRVMVVENEIIQTAYQERLLVERLQFHNAAQSRHLLRYAIRKEPNVKTEFYGFHDGFNKTLNELLTLEKDPSTRAALKNLRNLSEEVTTFRATAIRMTEDGKPFGMVSQFLQETSAPLSREITAISTRMAEQAMQNEAEALSLRDQTIQNLEVAIAALALVATILLASAALLIAKVTRQKRMADVQAERVSDARKEVVEVVAHDLKSPIATILMSAELLKETDALDPSSFQSCVDMIDRSAKAMHKLITDLLDHAKIEAGNMVIEPLPCNIGDLVEDVATRFQSIMQAKQIVLKLDVPSEKTIVHCDSGRIDQALSNLLGNAIKFTPENGVVAINCTRTDRGVEITVADSGPGLDESQIPHVFDRYWQARKTGQQGTGLGLAIVKSIVEAHHGQISVTRAPTNGARFHFDLPY